MRINMELSRVEQVSAAENEPNIIRVRTANGEILMPRNNRALPVNLESSPGQWMCGVDGNRVYFQPVPGEVSSRTDLRPSMSIARDQPTRTRKRAVFTKTDPSSDSGTDEIQSHRDLPAEESLGRTESNLETPSESFAAEIRELTDARATSSTMIIPRKMISSESTPLRASAPNQVGAVPAYLFKDILGKIQVAERVTIESCRKGAIADEPSFTAELLGAIRQELHDYPRTEGIVWDAAVFRPQGPGSLEKQTGADFGVVLNVNVGWTSCRRRTTARFVTAFLAQAKWYRDKPFCKRDYDKLREQCCQMLRITPAAYLFLYSSKSVEVISALAVATTPREGNSPRNLFSLSMDHFFCDFFGAFVGDHNLVQQDQSVDLVPREEVDSGAPAEVRRLLSGLSGPLLYLRGAGASSLPLDW